MQEKLVVMGIFIICAQAVVHFSPGNVYARYLKLLLSLMVLIQLLEPVLQITLGNSNHLQELAGNLWEQLDGQWSGDWENVVGYEEQITAIWDREVEEYAQEYQVGDEGIPAPADEQAQTSDSRETGETETVVIRVESMEKIRIGD